MKGSQFRTMREKGGFTQKRVADLFGKTEKTIARFETMEQVPLWAEAALRWHTRTITSDDRAHAESQRMMAHVANVRQIEEEERQRRLDALEKKHPGIFGSGGL